MNKQSLYIFDIDGTLADNSHRKHFVEKRDDSLEDWKPDWRAFEAACGSDAPNYPVIRTLGKIWQAMSEVWFFTGRSEKSREVTMQWLAYNTPLGFDIPNHHLVMRMDGDTRPDHVIKQEMLDAMLPEDRDRLIDDRNAVVNMWRRNGVACFQVAPGDF